MAITTDKLVQLGRLASGTDSEITTAYAGTAEDGFFYQVTDFDTYRLGLPSGQLTQPLITELSIQDDDADAYTLIQKGILKLKGGTLLKTNIQNTNEILTAFDLTGGSAYQVPRINAGGTDVEWTEPLSVATDSTNFLTISGGEISVSQLLVFNKTYDNTYADLAAWITGTSYDGTQDIDLLILDIPNETWLQTGSAGTAADFKAVSIDVSDSYIRNLLSGGEGIDYNSVSGAIALEYLRKTGTIPEFYNGTSWIEVFTAGNIDTDDVSEGTNLYYTQSRFDTAFTGKSTTDLSEGTNLYYTQSRFDTAFTGKSTTDLSEGTNLYYTQSRFDTAFTGKDTDALSEGAANLYYTTTRANAAIDARVDGQYISDLTGVDADTLGGNTPSYYTTPSNFTWGLTSGYLPYFDGSTLVDSTIEHTNFGYSSTYKVLQLGVLSGTQSISFGVDVSINLGHQFNGKNLVFPTSTGAIYPNAANDNWKGFFLLDDDYIRIGSNTFDFTTPLLSIGQDGNIGIGVLDASDKLTIKGNNDYLLSLEDTTVGNATTPNLIGLAFRGYNSVIKSAIYATDESSNFDRGQLLFYTKISGGSLTEKMRVDSDGNVGIGTNSPTQELDVNGNIKSTSFALGAVSDSYRVQTGYTGSEIRFLNNGNGYASVGVRSLVIGSTYTDNNEHENGGLLVQGDSGFGVESPLQKLHINGHLLLENDKEIRFRNQAATLQYTALSLNSDDNLDIGVSGGDMIFRGTSYAEIGRFTGSGNFGIGRSPSYKLDVNGTARVTNLYTGTGTPYTSNGVTIDAGIGLFTGGTNAATYRTLLDMSSSASYAAIKYTMPNASLMELKEDGSNNIVLTLDGAAAGQTATVQSSINSIILQAPTGKTISHSINGTAKTQITGTLTTFNNALKWVNSGGATYDSSTLTRILGAESDGTLKTITPADLLQESNELGVITHTQTAHGLTGQVVVCGQNVSGDYQALKADTTANAQAIGALVVDIPDVNTLKVKTQGIHTITSHGYTVGQWYCASTTTNGAVVRENTLTLGSDVIWRVFYVLDANTISIQVGQLYG